VQLGVRVEFYADFLLFRVEFESVDEGPDQASALLRCARLGAAGHPQDVAGGHPSPKPKPRNRGESGTVRRECPAFEECARTVLPGSVIVVPRVGAAETKAADDEMMLKVQFPKAAGVFAEDVMLLVNESHVLMTFLQVFNIDQSAKTAMAQVAAQVYLPIDDARRFQTELGKALERKGEAKE
jgi:hypothetical protein